MDLLQLFGIGLAASLGAFTLVWAISVPLRNAAIVDIAWGLGFVLVVWIYRALGPEPAVERQLLLLTLVTIWGLRLGGYIFLRGRGKGEDYRYAEMREKRGDAFWWQSLFVIFWLQAALVAVISLPYLFVQGQAVEAGWRWTDFLGLGLWAVGFFFEAVGDWQMARFKADPSNQGKVLDTGLWRYTRHPNYFGDATLWWGYFVIALGAPAGWWTLPCALLMTFLILKVSGVSLLEETITERRPKYRDYIERTNAFFPGPPKSSSGESRSG